MRASTKRTWVVFGILVALAVVSTSGHTEQGRVGIPAPEIANQTWLNSEPQRMADLRGKVVLGEFWTFYYAAFALDTDGHRIEAVCHVPQAPEIMA